MECSFTDLAVRNVPTVIIGYLVGHDAARPKFALIGHRVTLVLKEGMV